MIKYVIVALLLVPSASLAQTPAPDPEVTLKLSEWQLLTNKAIADREAEPVMQKIQGQMKPKPEAAPAPPRHPH